MEQEELLNLINNIDSLKPNKLQDLINKANAIYNGTDDLAIGFLLYKLSEQIMKIKKINPQTHELLEQCIKQIIKVSGKKGYIIGTEALRNIFNTQAQYYKTSNLDLSSKYPLGYSRPLVNYTPQVGQQCDIVKPYISSTTYCGWTRGTIISKDGQRFVVKYVNTQIPTETKQQPICAPLGTRTEDYQWRKNLQIGQRIDAFHKIWYLGTVVGKAIQNGVQRVRVTFKVFSDQGTITNAYGQKYDGFNDDEDQIYDIMSYRIQKPGKMSKSFCSLSLNSDEYILDDTYDLIFEQEYYQKPFNGIMRLNFTRSLSFLTFYDTFCQQGGNQKFLKLFQNNLINIDVIFNLMIVVANSSFLIPRMRVNQFLPVLMNKVINFLYENTKNLNPVRNQMAHFFLDMIGKRVFSLTQKHKLMNEVRKRLVLDFLKMNLQKQLIALRLIYELMNPIFKKYSEVQKQEIDQYFLSNNIFLQIIQPNVHEQVLVRSVELIKYLLSNNLISFNEIQYLWNIFPQTDARGRSTVQKMIGQIAKTFSLQYTKKSIQKILLYKQSELTTDNLSLLRSLKDHKDLQDSDRLIILQHLWQTITLRSNNITSTIQQEIQKVFKAILPALKDINIKLEFLKLLISRLEDLKLLHNQFDILKQFILTYPRKANNLQKIQEQIEDISLIVPQTISQVIEFLKKRKIYQIVITIVNQLKSQQKLQNVLSFTSFLFQHDQNNVDDIAQVFYDKMGPSQMFLEWAQYISHKAHQFFINIFNSEDQVAKFENLTFGGFQALKVIIFDINIAEGNLKLIRKTRGISVQTQTKSSQKLPGPVYGPCLPQKQETTTYLYLLKSPYEIKGMKFLQELLCVVKNNRVYDSIIKLVIQFFVNIDESIEERTQQFRAQFLMDIIKRIQQMNQNNEYNDKNKLKLEMSINLLQQLFAETQKEGLLDIKPHFECVKGQSMKLKLQNHLASNKAGDVSIQINANSTLWSLKVKAAQIFNEKAAQIDIYKFVNPIGDELNAKSISDLHFFNDQSIKVMRKSVKDIPRKELLTETGEDLTDKFNKIVKNWFDTYKNSEGYMGIQELKLLSGQCWKGSLLKQINRLNQMLKQFDKGQKGYLNFQEFKQFFIVKSSTNNAAIWRIINLSGYKNNLKHLSEPQKQVTSDIYPRRILSTQKVYDVIFSLLQNKTFEPVHLNFYRLLSMLQTDKNLKKEVQENAQKLIENQQNLYRLSYILETILSQILQNQVFFIKFYQNHGYQFIYRKLCAFMEQNNSIYTFDTLIKTIIMPNMLKILNQYIFCLTSEFKFTKFLENVKINHVELDFICKQLKKYEQTYQKKIQQQNIHQLCLIKSNVSFEQYYQLGEKIYLNLINFFSGDLLQRATNQVVRLYGCLSLALNKICEQQLIKGGLKSESLNYRRTSVNLTYLYLIRNNTQQKLKQTLDLLLQNLPQQSRSIYSYYFTLLEKVLEMYLDLKKNQTDDTEWIKLTDNLFNKLLNQLPNQKRNSCSADKLLFGVLVVLNIVLDKRVGVRKAFKHKKKELLEKCLFFYHPRERIADVQITPEMLKNQKQQNHFNDYVKCKSDDSRKELMEIIYHLHQVSAEEDPLFIDQYVLPIFNDLPQQKKKFETKSIHVGLNNLGSTCYLNSMLQILNAVAPFRNGIVQAKSEAPLVKQLKNMFSYLYFSERLDYVPDQLLNAFVPPILKGIQQDTTQFLNILFDQLESVLKGTQQAHLLQQIFQGTQAAQMICHSCGQKRQRKQHFFTYSVEIEGKYDLKSALEGMHAGQLIADCLCQYCGQRSDTTKRNVIENVPNLFFVHLKRIVFNYDVFMNTKIHTRLQFPVDLNFEPYTKQGVELRQAVGISSMKNLKDNDQQQKKFEQMALHGKDKDYYKLKLKGIIVHSGGPDVGHYWAILKKQNGWYKFDDSKVSVFTQSTFESQCFGGNCQTEQWGGMGSSTNAYVLIYEKQLKSDIVLGEDQNKKVVAFDKFQTFNTPQLYKDVWLDNHSLMLENHLLKQSYCKQFLRFITQMLRITPSDGKVRVISEILYKVCYHSGQTGKLLELLNQNISQITPTIFRNFLMNGKKRTFDLLFHNYSSVRQLTAVYIEKVLISTYKKGSDDDRKDIIQFIQEYLIVLHTDVAKNWIRIDGYFRLFEGLVVSSVEIPQLYSYFLGKNLITYFIDFILEKSSPLSIYPKKYSLGTKQNPANCGYAIKLIFFLFQRSYGLTGQNYEVPSIQKDQLYHLSDNDVLCLSSIEFYQKMMRERQNLEFLGNLIQRLSIKNIPFSQAISRVMLSILNEITDAKDQMIDICNCITKFLIIADEYWINRAQFVLGYSSPYIFNDNLLASIDQQRFVYLSTLEDLFPIQCLLAYCHINRLRNPLAVLHILRTILQSCAVNSVSKHYILSQKSPSYLHERYLDWIRPYINNVVQTLNINKEKKQIILKEVQICNNLITSIQEVKRPINNIITGKLGNFNIVDKIFNQDQTIQVTISNIQSYALPSIPTGQGNASLDLYLDHGRLNQKVTKNSNILCLFKGFSKPLAIKQAIEQDQDKQILSLFDEIPTKKPQISEKFDTKVEETKQVKKQLPAIVQTIQQQKIEVIPQIEAQVNVAGLELTGDYLRKIQVINNSTKTKRVTLKFKTNETSNMVVPSKIHFISSRKAIETMWLCKNDPTKGWGVVDYELIVQQKDAKSQPRWFKLYGGNNVTVIEQPMQLQTIVPQKNQMQAQYTVDPDFAQIKCPFCESPNLKIDTQCQVCGTPLHM